MNLTPWETGMHRVFFYIVGLLGGSFIFLRYRMICLPYLFCQQRDNPVSNCFPRSLVAWEKASSLGTNTIRASKQVLIPLIVGKSLNPFRQVLCNHCPLRRMAVLLGLPACSTRWWLHLLQEFFILALPLAILYILLSYVLWLYSVFSGYNIWLTVEKLWKAHI